MAIEARCLACGSAPNAVPARWLDLDQSHAWTNAELGLMQRRDGDHDARGISAEQIR